jgi:hypothetical protein
MTFSIAGSFSAQQDGATPTAPIAAPLPGLTIVPTPVPTPVPTQTSTYTVRLSEAAQVHQLEAQGQDGSQIAAHLGTSVASIGLE